jgi:uncharacterized protein (DUF433 family)
MAWHTDIGREELLGVGLYTPAEAAAYIHVQPAKLQRWVHGTPRREPLVMAEFPEHREVVSFLDMVQSMAIRDMRREHPDIDKPFAQRHDTYIIETTKQVGFRLPGDDPDHVMQVSGEHKGNYVHARMLDKYLKVLEFDSNGTANRYIPLKGSGNRRVVLDPAVRLGQPRVEPSGLLVEALVEALDVEGHADEVAWWYEIDREQVLLAAKYWRRIGGHRLAAAS